MMKTFKPDSKAVIVLGMHRSGTSAFTAALHTLRVELGQDMMPATSDNPTGYWEDMDIFHLNEQLLYDLGLAWHSVYPLSKKMFANLVVYNQATKAVDILLSKFHDASLWGFKDPRVCRLLPFWKRVLKHLGVRAVYVIAIRNPLSVAQSLSKRDGFDVRKSYLLWLLHMLPAIEETHGLPRVLVDYDALLADPAAQLNRIACAIGIPPEKIQANEIHDYADKFLSNKLRHTLYVLDDLDDESQLPRLAGEAYRWLYRVAKGEVQSDDPAFISAWEGISERLSSLAPAISYCADLDQQAVVLGQTITEHAVEREKLQAELAQSKAEDERLQAELAQRKAQSEQSQAELAQHKVQSEALVGELAQHKTQAEALQAELAQRTAQSEQSQAELAQHKAQSQALLEELSQRKAEVERLRAELSQHKTQAEALQAELAQRTAQSEQSQAELAQHKAQSEALREELSQRKAEVERLRVALSQSEAQYQSVLISTSWRLTAPIRAVGQRFSGSSKKTGHLPRPLRQTATLLSWRLLGNHLKKRLCIRRDSKLIAGSQLFDSEWYLAQNPDVAEAGISPVKHYLLHGAEEGRDPNPLFDSEWYLAQNPDVAEAGVNPLAHYLRSGAIEGRDPSPLFDSDWYLDQNPDVANAGINPFIHYFHWGTHEKRAPSAGVAELRRKNDYAFWIKCYDTLMDQEKQAIRSRIADLAYKPSISVIMPVFNPPLDLLKAAISSVQAQLYPYWELCIADDASNNPQVRSLLLDYAEQEERIKVVFRKENGHIAQASNSALELATGEFVALLDQDDLLAEHALYWVADAINQNPEVGLIYSDEDKIDLAGNRKDPYFKCDWNPELFLSHNMISHLGVYRTVLVREISGFRVGYEGSQDYDLALRCIEQLRSDQIHHIPRVLYHWRISPGSTAASTEEKPYAMLAGEKAINDHLKRMGVKAEAELLPDRIGYRVRYQLPNNPPLVSLIIPTRNGTDLIRQCITSILERTTYRPYEILIIDNGSDNPATLDYLDSLRGNPCIHILRDDRPFNYSALNNSAVAKARGEVIGLINNDIEVISPGWLEEMVGIALQPAVGAVGARLWYPDDTLQHGGVVLGLGGVAGHSHRYLKKGKPGYFSRAALMSNFSAVTGACLVVRKSIYSEVGGLNETDLTVAFNDVDFCLKLRERGYRNVWTPYAELYHHESATRGSEDTPEKKARFMEEGDYMFEHWGAVLDKDPAYSPNLTLQGDDFSFAWPPRGTGQCN